MNKSTDSDPQETMEDTTNQAAGDAKSEAAAEAESVEHTDADAAATDGDEAGQSVATHANELDGEEGILLDVDLDIDEAKLDLMIEAALLTTERAITPGKLAEAIGLTSPAPIRPATTRLNAVYEQTGRSFRIEQVAGGFQMLTLPEFGEALQAVHRSAASGKLSAAALETLAIVAYRQPILRANIEAIRGVAAGEVLRSLMDRQLVKIVGRAEEIGRPMLYGTTKHFLELFGLASLKDLPKVEDLTIKQPELTQSPTQDQDQAQALQQAQSSDDPQLESSAEPSTDQTSEEPDAPSASSNEQHAPAADHAKNEQAMAEQVTK